MLLVLAQTIHTLAGATLSPGALLVRRGRIVDAGNPETLRRNGARAVLDLGTATVTPALADAHIHLLEWALARREVDLHDAASPEEAVQRLTARETDGVWMRGGGWNGQRWNTAPHRALLDERLPGRAVALRSHDMHALWVSSEALRRAGLDRETPDPPGGRIARDAAGEPTGVLLENATRLVLDVIPTPEDAELQACVLEAQRELHALGIASVHSMEMPAERFHSLRVLEALRAAGLLRLRVTQHIPLPMLEHALALGLRSGMGDDWLRIGALKMFLDGALGSRTAWLRAPYEGSTDSGVRMHAPDEFAAVVRRAATGGLATTVHAIGDAAVSLALDVLTAPDLPRLAFPHRIEHIQLCPPERFEDAGRAGIVCSMQPAHLLTDWRPAEQHWGRERSRGAYAFASLEAAGATLAFGSDAPVEPVDPRLGFFAATERTSVDGLPAGGWFPEERLTMDRVLRAYTAGAAAAVGQEARLGVLTPGAEADFAAWDRDPLELRGRELLGLRCLATIVGGELVWGTDHIREAALS